MGRRKCIRCGAEIATFTSSNYCVDCQRENKKRICVQCGDEFYLTDLSNNRCRCYKCTPPRIRKRRPEIMATNDKSRKKPEPKKEKITSIAEENAEAREKGKTYGQLQLEKWLKENRMERMSDRLNRELKG